MLHGAGILENFAESLENTRRVVRTPVISKIESLATIINRWMFLSIATKLSILHVGGESGYSSKRCDNFK